MSLHYHSLHEGRLLQVGCVCCRPDHASCGELEHARANTVAFPLRGVFVKHHARGPEVVAHIGHAIFFNADEAYRVSHPTGVGDDCLVLRTGEAVLREILCAHDVPHAERENHPFRATHTSLAATMGVERSLLWQALRNREASTLEVEARSLSLLNAVLAQVAAGESPPETPARSRTARRREQSHAVAVLLAHQPERDWNLDELAQRVHASPFHLARSFRATLGEPIHRYQ